MKKIVLLIVLAGGLAAGAVLVAYWPLVESRLVEMGWMSHGGDGPTVDDGGGAMRPPTTEETATGPAMPDGSGPDEPPPPADLAAPPSFDVVRINEQGDAVIAGRAFPGAEVIILDGGVEIGRVTADANGEWVFVPTEPLPAGDRELSLRVVMPDGTVLESADVVVLSVPERTPETADRPVVAVKTTKDAPGRAEVLQGVEMLPPGQLAITALDYDEQGRFSISGVADPDAEVNLYIDNGYLDTPRADAQGRWHTAPGDEVRLTMEEHVVRADQVDELNRVVARVEAVFTPGAPIESKAKALVRVRSGHSLWRIARRMYGAGTKYTVIYKANDDQIRDPDLIYPGQIFELPDLPAGAAKE